MNDQYIPLSDLFSIIKISLNNPGLRRAEYNYKNSMGWPLSQYVMTSDNIYHKKHAPQKIIIPNDILNKILSPGTLGEYRQSATILLFPDDFYNSRKSDKIKYILEMKSYKDEHFQNMEKLLLDSDKQWRPFSRSGQIKNIEYKLRQHIMNNLLDKEQYSMSILVLEQHFAEHYFSKIKFCLRIGLTHSGLESLILLEKMSAENRDFFHILEFLYHDCDYIPLGRT